MASIHKERSGRDYEVHLLNPSKDRPYPDLLLALPNELLDQICDNIFHDDILNLRLVCKRVQFKTEDFFLKTFFKRKDLMIAPEDFEALLQMSQDPRVNSRLDHICISLTKRRDYSQDVFINKGLADSILGHALANLQDDPLRPQKRILSLGASPIPSKPHKWSPKWLARREDCVVRSGTHIRRCRHATRVNRASRSPYFSMNLFKIILGVFVKSGTAIQGLTAIFTEEGPGLHDQAFVIAPALKSQAALALTNLTLLHLQLRIECYKSSTTPPGFHLKDFLALTTNVTELRLDFRDSLRVAVDAFLFSMAETWKHGSTTMPVQSLCLQEVRADPMVLGGFISNIPTLQSLTLKAVALVAVDANSGPNLWADFIDRLVSFRHGKLKNLDNIALGPDLAQKIGVAGMWERKFLAHPAKFLTHSADHDNNSREVHVEDIAEHHGEGIWAFLRALTAKVQVSDAWKALAHVCPMMELQDWESDGDSDWESDSDHDDVIAHL